MASRAGSPHQTSIRLEGLEVNYTNGRPNKNLKLVITVSGQEPIKRKVARSGAIAWNGNILCPTSSTLTVDVYEKRKVFFWKRSARFETQLVAVESSSMSLGDASTATNVKLSFLGFEDTDAMEAERIREDAKAAGEKAEAKQTILDKLKKVRGLIDIIKPVGEAVSGIHPAIDAAFAGVGYLIEACEKQEASQKAALALTKEWDEFLSISDRVHVLKEREESRKAVDSVLDIIAGAANYLTNHTKTGALHDLFSQEYKENVDDFKAKFGKAMKSFELSLQVEAVKGINVLEQGRWLDILKPALEAHYRAGEENMCLKDTRVNLLRKASDWLRGTDTLLSSDTATLLRVFWLYGLAGSGKSSVANTVAATVNADKENFDLTCFFCKRDDPNLSNPQRFFPTLAYRIAQYYDDYRAALVDLLCSPDGAAIATSDVKTQFKLLFEDLLPKMTQPARSHVVVIDALDECGTPEDQGKLTERILSLAQAAPWIKVFITSRPVPEIRATFASSMDSCILSNINEEADTDLDIRRFTETNLERIREKHVKLVLSSNEVDQLVQKAAGLFIWSSTMFKYVRTSRNPSRELRSFLSADTSKAPLDQLYELYEQVLKSAVNASHKDDVTVLHAILGAVFVTAGNGPLSVEALSTFLHVDTRFEYEDGASVRNMTQALHAVLYEDASMGGAVRVYHPSFFDFLQTKLISGFQLGLEEVHGLVFKGCMATMDAELKFNICDLEDSSVLNKDVPDLDDRVSTCISEALYYSALFWFAHLSNSGWKHDEQVISSVYALLSSRKVLFWLEVLSLLKAVGRGVAILHGSILFFEGSAKLSDLAYDLERFVLMSSEAIMESTPHVYLSALAWVPEESATQKTIATHLKNVHFIEGKETNWQGARWVKAVGDEVTCVAYTPDGGHVAAGLGDHTIRILDSGTGEQVCEPLRGHSESVRSVAFSPDGQYVVSGSYDWSVRIWDAKTGAAVDDILEGHADDVYSVCFSPDGLHIASGSSDKTIRIWNAQTGAAVGAPLQGHSGVIFSVAFSPDGLHVVSGSDDDTVRIWNIESGTAVGDPLEGHEELVRSVCYSPDGQRIASGSEDKTVRIWDARTGAALLEPLRGHTGEVRSVAFSPDGQRIASGCEDGTIRIWDAQTGAAVGEPLRGHSNWIYSVIFSPDGQHIVSGSRDGTIRMWDIHSGAAVGDASQGHSDWVCSVYFSPDGQHVVSGSRDKSARIWNAKTGATIGDPLLGHEGTVNSVCFSPDGQHVASGSADKSIRIWNACTSAVVGEPLEGHTDEINSVAFSPDGLHVVSGSNDHTVRIWDTKSGEAIGEPLKGHEECVWSVCYSPGGERIASGSEDKTIRIWDARTGAALLEPLRGHTGEVRSVAFSPDGQRIVSGSDDGTIRIWDAQTGAAINGDPMVGHSWPVFSVAFSSDGRKIVSGSYDRTVRIWDVQKGTMIGDPFRGHFWHVLAVAFSPDGQRIASGSIDKTVRIWNACIGPVDDEGISLTDRGATHRAHWNACCARMDIADGWVRDGEKLLLWIPYRFRKNIKERLHVSIGRYEPRIVKPEVDLEKLYAYMGTKWTRLYEL